MEHLNACMMEHGRALDFEIRNTPIHHLMKTKLLEASGQFDDALKVLQAAMELPDVRKPLKAGGAGGGAANAMFLSAAIQRCVEESHDELAQLSAGDRSNSSQRAVSQWRQKQ